MWYGIRWRFRVTLASKPDTADRKRLLERHLGRVMEELVDLEGHNDHMTDPAIGADVSAGEVELELEIKADSPANALDEALAILRTAVHAAGGFTGSWDTFLHERSGTVEYGLLEVEAEPVPA